MNKNKKQYTTPISIIEKMIRNGELGEYTSKKSSNKLALGGALTVASQILPIAAQLKDLFSNKTTPNPLNENVNPYGYKNGGKLNKSYKTGGTLASGYKQYNANNHEDGGQLVNNEGTPVPNGQNEIEGTENTYNYKNMKNKQPYVFSDANKTSVQLKEILNRYKKKNVDSDEMSRNSMEFEINRLEQKNEVIKAKQEAVQMMTEEQQPNMFKSGGPLDLTLPLPNQVLSINPNNNFNPQNITGALQIDPIRPLDKLGLPNRVMSNNPSNNFNSKNIQLPTSSNNNLTTGSPDQMSIDKLPETGDILRAGVLGVNTLGLFNKAEKESLITPDYSAADRRMGRMNSNLDAARNEALSATNASSDMIRSASSSFQQMQGRDLQNQANLTRALGNVSLNEQQTRNQIDQSVGSYEAGKAGDIANRQYQNRVDNLQNEAQNRNIKRAILGDTLAEADRISSIKNNERIMDATVAETTALLSSIYPDTEITGEWVTMAKKLSQGEITDKEYQDFVKKTSPIKFK